MSIYRGRTNTEVYLASALYDAIDDHDYSAIVNLLTVKNSDANMVLPRRGISPFHLAIGSDPPDFALKVTSLILQNGGDPNVQSDEGLTPLHIAAAWNRTEILRLLLNCGGNPEITDNCYKNALYYAEREGHQEATETILEFIKVLCVSELADYWEEDKVQCKLALDKIVVNNPAGLIGEYEAAKEGDDADNVIVAEDLNKLPQANNDEYVLNWCNSQAVASRGELYTDESSPSSLSSSYENTKLSRSQKSCIEANAANINCKKRVGLIGENICYHRETSRESGIATLPGSLSDDKIFNGYVLLTTDSDVSIEDPCDCGETKKKKISKTKDASSDYYTCTDVSEDMNVLEQNVYEISSLSSSGKSSSSPLDQTNPKVNCVSISEIYKYTDDREGVVLFEKRSLPPSVNNQNDSGGTNLTKSSKLSSLPRSFNYDTDSLRKELTNLGYDPGPITKSTKRVYLRKLYHLKKHPDIIVSPPKENDICKKVYSSQLERTLREPNWADDLTAMCKLEADITKDFSDPRSTTTRRWREGLNKSSFTYLLLDPRITKNLPCRADSMTQNDLWETFLSSIFYVGKGKRTRPYSHLYDAIAFFNKRKDDCNAESNKIKHILEIWRDNRGVICLHVFQNVIPVEAYTREAAMISALQTENLTNIKAGDFYGVAATWTKHQRNLLGVYLLYKAMRIFLNEGERQLSPRDID